VLCCAPSRAEMGTGLFVVLLDFLFSLSQTLPLAGLMG
jgi:hypothetical protein